MLQKLVNCVPLPWIHAEQMGDEVLGAGRNVIPPRAQKSVVSSRNLLCEQLDGFVVEWWKPAQERVKHAPEGPHIDSLAVAFVLDDLGGSVTNGAARSHGLLVPNNLRETKVGDLNAPDATAADAGNELAFILLFLVAVYTNLWLLGRDDRDLVKEQVLRLDIAICAEERGRKSHKQKSDYDALHETLHPLRHRRKIINLYRLSTYRCTTPRSSCKYRIPNATCIITCLDKSSEK